MTSSKIIKKACLLFLMITPSWVYAGPSIVNSNSQCPDPDNHLDTVFGCINKGSNNQHSATALPDFVVMIFNWTIGIIATLATLGIIYAGFTYTTAAGNPDRIKLAKDIIITSISGLLLVIFSYAMFKLLGIA